MKKQFSATLLFTVFASLLSAHPWTAGRPDGHAPLGVMGDHMHGKGEWMASYRYMTMDMEGLRSGSTDVTFDSQVGMGKTYGMAPTKMTMNMHMFGAMHAVSDKLTIMGMVNYLENDMDMKMMNGTSTSANSSGLGDLKISGLYDLKTWDHDRRLHLNLGLSLPTGDIDERPHQKSSCTATGRPASIDSATAQHTATERAPSSASINGLSPV